MSKIKDLWKILEDLLKKECPEELTDLNPPVTTSEISEVEKYIGVHLPDQYKELLKIHNGQKYNMVFLGYDFITVQEIPGQWSSYQDVEDTESPNNKQDSRIKKIWFNKKWIPFLTTGTGDCLCFDMDPASGGKVGQIILMYHDYENRSYIADDLEAFMAKNIEDYTKHFNKHKEKKNEKEKPSWWHW
jgi:cell wall assembly regulator SMI1